MNLILLEPEQASQPTVVLRGRQARHVRKVLRSAIGDRLRVGALNGPQGSGRVTQFDTLTVTLELDDWSVATPPPGTDVLVLGIARPKVLLRCLEHASALGYGRIVLVRTKRVDKNHLLTGALEPATYQERLKLGLEQARRTHLPELQVYRRFQAFIAEQARWLTRSNRFTAHPGAAQPLAPTLIDANEPHSLVIGPEGGLLDFEVEALSAEGFVPVRAGSQPLRVECALSFLSGCLWGLKCDPGSSV